MDFVSAFHSDDYVYRYSSVVVVGLNSFPRFLNLYVNTFVQCLTYNVGEVSINFINKINDKYEDAEVFSLVLLYDVKNASVANTS